MRQSPTQHRACERRAMVGRAVGEGVARAGPDIACGRVYGVVLDIHQGRRSRAHHSGSVPWYRRHREARPCHPGTSMELWMGPTVRYASGGDKDVFSVAPPSSRRTAAGWWLLEWFGAALLQRISA